jgi:hypothetical protein
MMSEPPAPDATRDTQAQRSIAAVAAELRACLTPLVHALAGTPPRPIRLTQGPGLDKSLASRLVQATKTGDDLAFLHQVPSPTGLRILVERSRGLADGSLLNDLQAAIQRFEALLDTLPGGRQTLDAHMGEASSAIRERREQMARQASFKAQSFLFGHYCDTLITAMFIVPSARAGLIDVIEVHRRIGLQRLAASTPLPLLSVHTAADPEGPGMMPLRGEAGSQRADDYLVDAACSRPLPALEVVREGATTTFVLAPGGTVPMPARVTTAWRVIGAETLVQTQAWNIVRNYMLHTPCQTLVRDLYIANGLWPDAWPVVGFYLPGPSGTPPVVVEPGQPHLRRLNLTARIEQRPAGATGFALEGVDDQRLAIEQVLALAEVPADSLRGWRCRMSHPVPLIEMQLALRFAAR